MSSTSSTGPPGSGSRETASEPSTLRACWTLFAIDFCSARSSVFESVGWNGKPISAAKRSAKSGTRCGCRLDGMQVTHSGAGRGAHCAIRSAQARTRSSANRPSRYLPCRTSPPQPASPQMQSAFPVSARCSAEIAPRISYSGIPPVGHRLRGSMGRLVRRRNATACCKSPGSTSVGNGGTSGGRTVSGFPSSARMRNAMCPDSSLAYSCIWRCSSRRRAVRRSARSQNSSLKSAAVNCHLVSCFATGAGDSSESSAIVFSIRPEPRLTLPSSSGTERPSGTSSSASITCRTSSWVGNALAMNQSVISVSSSPLSSTPQARSSARPARPTCW